MDLYDLADAPAQRHSATSRAAADAIGPAMPRLRRLVLDALEAAGAEGLTDEEMQQRLGMNPSTQRPRRIELLVAGLILDSGRTRKTASGRQAVIWIVCERKPD